MKREIAREERLPAFDLSVPDLQSWWERMVGLFDASQKLQASIDLSLPFEKLQFDSLEELLAYGQVKGRVTDFTLRIRQEIAR